MTHQEINNLQIAYDAPFEVNRAQYTALKAEMAGVVAHMEENGRYYVKPLWQPRRYEHNIKHLLKIHA